MSERESLAKLRWQDPVTGDTREYVLTEGAIITLGRSSNNNIRIAEQHISRQHAIINYRDGVFVLTDLDSSNGTFVNGNRLSEPYPLFAGDKIRLFVSELQFLAADTADLHDAEETGQIFVPSDDKGQGTLIVMNGPQKGQIIPLLLDVITVGRATSNGTWEIALQDPSVSRPHASFERIGQYWHIRDLGSSNGTMVNQQRVTNAVKKLGDGDTVTLGASILLFRTNYSESQTFERGLPTAPFRDR